MCVLNLVERCWDQAQWNWVLMAWQVVAKIDDSIPEENNVSKSPFVPKRGSVEERAAGRKPNPLLIQCAFYQRHHPRKAYQKHNFEEICFKHCEPTATIHHQAKWFPLSKLSVLGSGKPSRLRFYE